MRRYGKLWDKIVSAENIREGVINACNSKGRNTPAKKRNIAYTREHINETVVRVREMLMRGFHTSRYYVYPLFDPKLRFIYCLPFYPDRVVHHCLLNVLVPIWDSMMYSQSFACRKNYGQHAAGTLCGVYAKHYRYCAQFDLSQFYVTINHGILKQVLRRKIKDEKTLAALDEIIDSVSTRERNLELLYQMQRRGVRCEDIPREVQKLERSKLLDSTPAGLPIGNYTSQWLGNIYLTELDKFVKQGLRVKPFVRYCDDFLLFGDDKRELRRMADEIEDFLFNGYHMILSKREVYPTTQGVDFVGYRYFRSGKVLLRKRVAKKQQRMLRVLRARMESGNFDIERARGQLGSLNGLLQWANGYHYRRANGVDALTEAVMKFGEI